MVVNWNQIDREGPVAGSYEDDNEPLASIKTKNSWQAERPSASEKLCSTELFRYGKN
jgi:hypothetical protein